ncbi:MAG TPA: pentapeptide repeat-containing protein, partial [Ktedonobacteraceae bacterium]|nr:pentapeptide repeat-containing protein [Ktedonobacteraceae bacterium]
MSQSSEISLFPPNDAEQWKEHWRTQGLPWRTEPEISKGRQEELAQLRSIAVDVIRKVYPFKDVGLSRADIEWLLITHESEGIYGPVIYNDERHWKRRGIDIRGAYLAQVNLRDLPLTRMQGAVLPHEVTGERKAVIAINLDKADLAGAHLEEAFLAGSSLKRANLTGANLEMASLEEAHLEGANLSEAHMAEVNLTHAHLENAVLIKAHVEEANCRGAFLEGANFGEGHLEGADLKETSLAKTRFTRAHLEGADLRRARAGGGRADFHATHLEGANLEETSLEKADFRDAHLEGALLGEAHLEGADFRKAYLAGADLRAAHLEGADLKETHLEGKSLRPSDVKRIREWLQDFPEVLWPADLREALFSSETRLKDAILGDK